MKDVNEDKSVGKVRCTRNKNDVEKCMILLRSVFRDTCIPDQSLLHPSGVHLQRGHPDRRRRSLRRLNLLQNIRREPIRRYFLRRVVVYTFSVEEGWPGRKKALYIHACEMLKLNERSHSRTPDTDDFLVLIDIVGYTIPNHNESIRVHGVRTYVKLWLYCMCQTHPPLVQIRRFSGNVLQVKGSRKFSRRYGITWRIINNFYCHSRDMITDFQSFHISILQLEKSVTRYS